MKGTKRQREKEMDKTKTKPPHSIGASVSSKVLAVSKKSQAILKKPDKPATMQSKLVSVKGENGTKSLIVSKISTPSASKTHATRSVKSASAVLRPAASQVELKKNLVVRQKVIPDQKSASVSKENKAESKEISCEHCNLHFSTEVWLKKHIERNHRGATSPKVDTKADPKAKILNYKKQLEVIQKTLDKKNSGEKLKKKAKVSPTKTKLREQLKAQLAAQQKLLQVQQEIFEKTSKAQQDIFQLIAKLGDDESGDDVDDNESEERDDEDEQEIVENVQLKDEEKSEEIYFETDGDMGELIVADNTEYAYLPSENYAIEEQLVAEDNNFVLMNDQKIGTTEMGVTPDDQTLMVIVQSGDGEEEYELIDVVEDQMYENNPLGEIGNGIDFEVVANDSDSLHCRIVSNEEVEEAQEDIEYVDVQVEKVPVKIELGKIQEIAQKRFNKQLEGGKEDTDSKLLNSKIHTSEKHTNEYIQKVVQNAVPTDDNKFECPICHEMVSNRYSLGPHILRLHSKQKSKICQYCDRSFTCTGDLTRHVRIHTGEKPFKCTYPNCTYAFRASGDLHKHMRRHNSATVNIRQHVCKQCDRAFERNYDLKRHELTHKKNEEGVGYNCEFCSKRFVRKDQHKAHVYRHLGIKQYKCPDCNRQFSDFSNCSKHIRQCQAGDVQPFGSEETGPQYICEICNKRFKSKVGMKQHVVKCAKITELQKKLQESFKDMEDED